MQERPQRLQIRWPQSQIIRTFLKASIINLGYRILRSYLAGLNHVVPVTKLLNRLVAVESTTQLICLAQCYQVRPMGYQKRLLWRKPLIISKTWKSSSRKPKRNLRRNKVIDWAVWWILLLYASSFSHSNFRVVVLQSKLDLGLAS